MLVYIIAGDLKMDELVFEWDENKRVSNIEKHGFDFRDAAVIFIKGTKPIASLVENNELRHMVTGELNGKYVTIIYTIRETGYRVISLRHARKREIGLLYSQRIAQDEERNRLDEGESHDL
jgi:uncharacterized DUF497 family protein